MQSRDIRQSFLDFFSDRGHQQIASAPLVPHDDPTLLFTNAGMVQFKDYFLGVKKPDSPRAVTSQKCLRVSGKHNDLENVGPSPRHHTFFEMLGNFSFGDYFKDEAIRFAWELVTEGWGLPPEHLYATVFLEDDEAHELWGKISTLPAERIVRCGAEDNFWAMGDTGPCGPCSEIFIDRFPDLAPIPFEEGAENGRYLEIWNLVFMQFERSASGDMEPLPKPSIDTGSGLERVAAALQGVASNYDTDLFQPILRDAAQRAGRCYGDDDGADTSLRVIADHIRAVAFLLADGVIPSNEGRGYVLRRVLRRAVRHGMRLGLEEPFLGSLLPALDEAMSGAYPELSATRRASESTIHAEEEKFLGTIASGARQVQEAIEQAKAAGSDRLDGDTVFRLYDTHGLPLETVQEIAEEEQLGIDQQGFEKALEGQRQRSRSATSQAQSARAGVGEALRTLGELPATEFVGYDELSLEGARVAHLVGGEPPAVVDQLGEGQHGVVLLDRTVFYAESGGQVADHGQMQSEDGTLVRVDEVQKTAAGVFQHFVQVVEGTLSTGDVLRLEVEAPLRQATERHHTATHLLHAALRQHLGEGVRQAGSLVHPERLRFDFTHGQPVDGGQQAAIEHTVNDWVRRARGVEIRERSYDEAVSSGAMALFGEKYGDVVRTVDVPGISLELCGGCHVANTGALGSFVIVGERGVASGVRRIEALAGEAAEQWLSERRRELSAAEQALGVSSDRLSDEISSLKARLRDGEKELEQLRMKLLSGGPSDGGESGADEVCGVPVMFREVPLASSGELRNLTDVLRGKLGSGVVVVGARGDDKLALLAAITPDLEGRVHAGQLAKAMGQAVGGSGGGRGDFAQAGGKDPQQLDAAFAAARSAIEGQLAS